MVGQVYPRWRSGEEQHHSPLVWPLIDNMQQATCHDRNPKTWEYRYRYVYYIGSVVDSSLHAYRRLFGTFHRWKLYQLHHGLRLSPQRCVKDRWMDCHLQPVRTERLTFLFSPFHSCHSRFWVLLFFPRLWTVLGITLSMLAEPRDLPWVSSRGQRHRTTIKGSPKSETNKLGSTTSNRLISDSHFLLCVC